MHTPRRLLAAAVVLAGLAVAPAAQAERLIALGDVNNTLYSFDSASPGTFIGAPLVVTGMAGGETLYAIDVRPSTGELYGTTNQSHVYVLNPVSGAATRVGTGEFNTVPFDFVGMDFNPVADRIRVVDSFDKNMRVNPFDGTLVAADTNLHYADPGNPAISNVAYTNNFSGATATTLYGIDANFDTLVTVNPPNDGVLNTVGVGLSVDVAPQGGFDIAPSGVAYAVLRSGGVNRLHTIDLVNGIASAGTAVSGNPPLDGLAAYSQPPAPVRVDVPSRVVAENSGTTPITIRRIGGTLLEAVTVDVTIGEGTATRPDDFVTTSTTVTFAGGETTKTLDVAVVDDAVHEGNEFFQVSLSNARSSTSGPYAIGDPDTTVVGIVDDDAAPVNTGPTGATGPQGASAPTLFVALARAAQSSGRRARLKVPYVASAVVNVKVEVLKGTRVVGRKSGRSKVGRNTLAFAKKKRFRPGRYTLRLTATAGAASSVDTTKLTIRRR